MDASKTAGMRDYVSSASSSDRDGVPLSTEKGMGMSPEIHHDKQSSTMKKWTAWTYELASCLLSLLCVVAMLATLLSYQGRPIPKLPFSITINSLLSIYGVVFKANILFTAAACLGQMQWSWFSRPQPFVYRMLFDEATKGPWGSLVLVWAQRMRQPLVVLGTVIAIMAAIVDPFIQALAQTKDCHIPLSSAAGQGALLPRTNRLTPGDHNDGTQRALVNGLFSPGQTIESPARCVTGNCTFDEVFSTLGYCSSCEDISDRIETYDTKVTSGTEFGVEYINTNSKLPSGLNMSYPGAVDSPNEGRGGQVFVANVSLSPDYADPNQYIQFMAGDVNRDDGDGNYGLPMMAASCVIKPCVRYNKAQIIGGRVEEELVEESDVSPAYLPSWWLEPMNNSNIVTGANMDPGAYALLDLQCTSPDDLGFLTQHGYDLDQAGRWLPFGLPNIDVEPDASLNFTAADSANNRELTTYIDSLLERECLFIFDYETAREDLFTLLREFLGGTLYYQKVIKFLVRGRPQFTVTQPLAGPMGLQGLYNYGDMDFPRVEEMMKNMTNSLTWFVRMGSESANPNYSHPASGEATDYATCLEVHWKYMAFPAALVFLTLVMLVCVVVLTIHQNLPPWKCSPLAWQFRDSGIIPRGSGGEEVMRSESFQEQPRPRTQEEMEKVSKGIMVSLQDKTDPSLTCTTEKSTLSGNNSTRASTWDKLVF